MEPTMQTPRDATPALPEPPPTDRKKFIIIVVAIALFLIVLLIIFFAQQRTSPASTTLSPTPTNSANSQQPNNKSQTKAPPEQFYSGQRTMEQKITELKEFPSSYKLYPASPSQAIVTSFLKVADINLTNLPDGSVKVDLQAKDVTLKLPNFIVKKGYSIYIIDTEFAALGRIEDLGDDFFVLVDDKGYVMAD